MAQPQHAAPEQQSFEAIVADAAQKAGFTEAPEAAVSPPAERQTESKPDLGEPIPLPQDDKVDAPAPTDVKLKSVEEAAKPPETVPLAVHIRQRQRSDQENARTLKRIIAVGSERLAALEQRLTPAAPLPPDPNEDPLGAALSEIGQLRGQVKQIADMTLEERRQAQVNADIAQFKTAVAQDEQAFTAQQPDLAEAITYAKDIKFREYMALGMDPQQASARVQQDAFALANHAFQNGYSPSALIYRMAGALGYRKGVTAGGEPVVPAEPAAPQVPAPTQAEQAVEMRAAGADRAKAAGGAPARTGPMTLQELANLPNDEFAKLTAGKKWDRLFK